MCRFYAWVYIFAVSNHYKILAELNEKEEGKMLNEQDYIQIRNKIDEALDIIEESRSKTDMYDGAGNVYKTEKKPIASYDRTIGVTLCAAASVVQYQIDKIRKEDYGIEELEASSCSGC